MKHIILIFIIFATTASWATTPASEDILWQTLGGCLGGIAGYVIGQSAQVSVLIGYPLGITVGVNTMALLRGKPLRPIETFIGAYWGSVFAKGSSVLTLGDTNKVQLLNIGSLGTLILIPPISGAVSYSLFSGESYETR